MANKKEQEANNSDPLHGMTTLTRVATQLPYRAAWRGSSQPIISRTTVVTLALAAVLGMLIGNFLLQLTGAKSTASESRGVSEMALITSGVDAQGTTTTGFVCPRPESAIKPSSRELNLLVWTEYVPNDWTTCFEYIYGIKVNRTEFSSNEEMFEILQRGDTTFDLIQPSDSTMKQLIDQGLLQKFDKNQIKVLNNFNPTFMNQPFDPDNDYSLPYQAGSYAIAVNTTNIESPPTLWRGLWDSKYTGQILVMDDARVMIGITLLAMGHDLNTTDPEKITSTKEQLVALLKNTKQINSDTQSASILAGEIDLGIFWNGEAFLAQRENSVIELVYPLEGAILWQDNYALSIKAQHSDAAYAWLNYTMQGDVFWLMLRDFPYINPNKAALNYAKGAQPELYNAYMNSMITNVPSDVMLRGHWIETSADLQPLYEKIWQEAKAEAGFENQ